MLTVILRVAIIFLVLLLVMRMMGKRQIGEMEPFELAITLVIAELACVPMADKSIPLTYGIISILTMYVVHQLIILLSKRKKLQGVISGTPVIVIDKGRVKYDALKSMNMQMSDLLQAMRAAGYFSIDEIAYAIFETNGQLSVVPNSQQNEEQATLPVPIVIDGQWSETDLQYYNVDKQKIENILTKHSLTADKVILATIDENGKLLIHPEEQRFFVEKVKPQEVHNG